MENGSEGKTNGYHLFLRPPEPLAAQLRRTVGELAAEFGGPVFEPHVTVLARIPAEEESALIEKSAALAKEGKPLRITFGDIGMEDAYFRTLYLRANPTEELSSLHARANEIFGMQDENSYMPHVSLLYGDYPQERKEASAASITEYRGTSFIADRIYLYQTDGETKNWRFVQEFPFAAV